MSEKKPVGREVGTGKELNTPDRRGRAIAAAEAFKKRDKYAMGSGPKKAAAGPATKTATTFVRDAAKGPGSMEKRTKTRKVAEQRVMGTLRKW
jgi:hypothetical protein